MEELTKSQKGRYAIRLFKTVADALALRGYYKPSGKSGRTMEEGLKLLSPEIYGSMNDHRIIELKGLEYVIDRLPRGIGDCTRIILTAQEDLEGTSFEKIIPPRRRRTSYRVSQNEICFVITRGLSEIYDILTHITFLNVEARKIKTQMFDDLGNHTKEWKNLEETIRADKDPEGEELDKSLWNLSIILGRTYHATRDTYECMETNRQEFNSNRGLFKLIYSLGIRAANEETSREKMLLVTFTPSLQEMIGHHMYARKWAEDVKKKLFIHRFAKRPIHIISANLHSVKNLLYGYAAVNGDEGTASKAGLYDAVGGYRDHKDVITEFGKNSGMLELKDASGSFIDYQIIDTAGMTDVKLHPELNIKLTESMDKRPVIIVMDYAFGTQAFEVMDELLGPYLTDETETSFEIRSISVMGKAGILPGKQGDIMLATSHVFEGTADNYIVTNDLGKDDFDESVDVYTGPILTVFGTSLQNRDVLKKFQETSWKVVGLEMEGGHYQKAISAAIIRGHISSDVKVRYAYYASDNPLISGQTLASGAMGEGGIKPTYMITKVILEKVFSQETEASSATITEDQEGKG